MIQTRVLRPIRKIDILTGKLMVCVQGEIYSSSKGVTCEDRLNTKRNIDEKDIIIFYYPRISHTLNKHMFYVTNCRVMVSRPSFSECLSIYIQKSPLDFSEHKNFKANPQQLRHLRMPLKSLLQLTSRSLCTTVPSHHINALWSLSISYFLKTPQTLKDRKSSFL